MLRKEINDAKPTIIVGCRYIYMYTNVVEIIPEFSLATFNIINNP